jgi:D-glycero-D-manno-heptose 1,7-bisphosphate phosphatase
MNSAVFFERDGILNKVIVRGKHQVAPMRVEHFHVNMDCLESLERLKEAGLLLIATTNQPGVARGIIDRRELDLMHSILMRQLPLDAIYHCPYDEPDNPCYKPGLGQFREAAFEWRIDLDHSFVVSDKWQDARAAHNLGCYSLLLDSPWIGEVHHDYICRSLEDIVDKILQLNALNHRSAMAC